MGSEDKESLIDGLITSNRVEDQDKTIEEKATVHENSDEMKKLINEEVYSLIDEDDLTNPEADKDESEKSVEVRGPMNRYFTDESNVKCHHCYKRGHQKQFCPLNTMVCNYCLGPHERKNCANELFCYNCGGKDHMRSECKVRDRDKCFRCNKAFHTEKDCYFIVMMGNVVDNYHITNANCLLCGSSGHPNCSMRKKRDLYIRNDNIYGSDFRSRMYQVPVYDHQKSKSSDNSLKNLETAVLRKRSEKSEHSYSNNKHERQNSYPKRDGSNHDWNNQKHRPYSEKNRDSGYKPKQGFGDLYDRGQGNFEGRNNRNQIDMTNESSRSMSGKNSTHRYNGNNNNNNQNNRRDHDRRWVDRR